MKLSRKRKNARLKLAGLEHQIPTRANTLDQLDPEQWALETLAAMRLLPVGQLTPEVQEKIDGWMIPMVRCAKCSWAGLLTEATRIPNSGWTCPLGHHLPDAGLNNNPFEG